MDTIGWPAATVCRTSVGVPSSCPGRIYINYVSLPRLGLLCKWRCAVASDVSDRVVVVVVAVVHILYAGIFVFRHADHE